MKKIPKIDRVLHYIKEHGKITKSDAAKRLQVYGLGDMIRRLRLKGFIIQTQMMKGKNTRYAVYTLGH